MNDWVTADEIANGIYEGKLDLSWSLPLIQAMTKALDWCVSPIYKQLSGARRILPGRFGTGKFQLKADRQVEYYSHGDNARGIRQATKVDKELFDDL